MGLVLSPTQRDLLRGLVRGHYAQIRGQLGTDQRLTDEGRQVYLRELDTTRDLIDQLDAEARQVAA